MKEEHSFRKKVVEGMAQGGTAQDLYARANRFGEKNWTTLGLCLVSKADVCRCNEWKELRPTRHTDDRRQLRPLGHCAGHYKEGDDYHVLQVTTERRSVVEINAIHNMPPIPDSKLGPLLTTR
jgi:hypothetical protein